MNYAKFAIMFVFAPPIFVHADKNDLAMPQTSDQIARQRELAKKPEANAGAGPLKFEPAGMKDPNYGTTLGHYDGKTAYQIVGADDDATVVVWGLSDKWDSAEKACDSMNSRNITHDFFKGKLKKMWRLPDFSEGLRILDSPMSGGSYGLEGYVRRKFHGERTWNLETALIMWISPKDLKPQYASFSGSDRFALFSTPPFYFHIRTLSESLRHEEKTIHEEREDDPEWPKLSRADDVAMARRNVKNLQDGVPVFCIKGTLSPLAYGR